MALSDCAECWETPCCCGHQYRGRDTEWLLKMRDMFDELIRERQCEVESYPEGGSTRPKVG